MGKGFFKPSQVQSKKVSQQQGSLAHCGKCKLYETCKNPKMPPTGNGSVRILHVAEAPGATEDKKNEQLVGQVGQYYRRVLRKFGMDIDDGLKTNACICRPPDNKKPTISQVKACRPNLLRTIKDFQPHVIIALGEVAFQALMNHKFPEKIESVQKWVGHIIPDREYNAWICTNFHPSYVQRETTPEIVEKLFETYTRRAIRMLDIPLPEYAKDETANIELLKHEKDANAWLRDLLKKPVLTAFDYETTGLKPQRKEQRIRTSSISLHPDHAVAFSMFDSPKFLSLFKDYLASKELKKIGANVKYERDWTVVKLMSKLRGLLFDTNLAAHFIDNKPGITSLDFQNYVNFGIEPYDAHLKKYLKPDNSYGNDINDIDKINLGDLLIYNGMDSMTEFRQGLIMMDVIGIDYRPYYDGPSGFDLCPQIKEVRNERTKNRSRNKSRRQRKSG